MTADFYTLHEHRQTPMYIDVMAPLGIDHEMMVCLPDGPGRQLRLLVWRGRTDPEFTERDRVLLTLLRPHLYAAHVGAGRCGGGSGRSGSGWLSGGACEHGERVVGVSLVRDPVDLGEGVGVDPTT